MPDPDQGGVPTSPGGQGGSDLVGAGLTAALIIWFGLVLAAFFFVGALAGIIVLLAGVLLGGFRLAAFVRRNDLS